MVQSVSLERLGHLAPTGAVVGLRVWLTARVWLATGVRSMAWAKGDRVIHATKPEWGVGEVLTAEAAGTSTASKEAQRLTIRFERGGTKAISTEFAELKPMGDMPLRRTNVTDEGKVFSFAPTPTELKELMTRLPENATDPFVSLQKRFQATLDLYRFGDTGALLLDWACMQTGLKDPLSRFNRHELEQWFSRFKIEADDHLKKLSREIRKADPRLIDAAAASCGASAKQALRRVDFGR